MTPRGSGVSWKPGGKRWSRARTIAPSLVQRLDRRYAAPEVWSDPKAASPLSDQYAFGTILLELLAGRSLDDDAADLSTWTFDERVPEEARQLVLTMRAPRAADRYPTLEEAMLVLDLLA